MSVHTVRYYCDCSLVPNLKRDKSDNRIFDEESLNWLKAAKFLPAAISPFMKSNTILNYVKKTLLYKKENKF